MMVYGFVLPCPAWAAQVDWPSFYSGQLWADVVPSGLRVVVDMADKTPRTPHVVDHDRMCVA